MGEGQPTSWSGEHDAGPWLAGHGRGGSRSMEGGSLGTRGSPAECIELQGRAANGGWDHLWMGGSIGRELPHVLGANQGSGTGNQGEGRVKGRARRRSPVLGRLPRATGLGGGRRRGRGLGLGPRVHRRARVPRVLALGP